MLSGRCFLGFGHNDAARFDLHGDRRVDVETGLDKPVSLAMNLPDRRAVLAGGKGDGFNLSITCWLQPMIMQG